MRGEPQREQETWNELWPQRHLLNVRGMSKCPHRRCLLTEGHDSPATLPVSHVLHTRQSSLSTTSWQSRLVSVLPPSWPCDFNTLVSLFVNVLSSVCPAASVSVSPRGLDWPEVRALESAGIPLQLGWVCCEHLACRWAGGPRPCSQVFEETQAVWLIVALRVSVLTVMNEGVLTIRIKC